MRRVQSDYELEEVRVLIDKAKKNVSLGIVSQWMLVERILHLEQALASILIEFTSGEKPDLVAVMRIAQDMQVDTHDNQPAPGDGGEGVA